MSDCPELLDLALMARGGLDPAKAKDILAHVKTCESCQFLVSIPTPANPAPEVLENARVLWQLSDQEPPERLGFGQIWRVLPFLPNDQNNEDKEDDDEEPFVGTATPQLAVISFGDLGSALSSNPDARVCFLGFEFDDRQAPANLAVRGAPADSPLGRHFVIEHWDERSILCRQLDQYLGILSDEVAQRLEDFLNRPPEESLATLPVEVARYRQHRLVQTAPFSGPWLSAHCKKTKGERYENFV